MLDSFAPNFIASLFRGTIRFSPARRIWENLLGALRLAGLSE